ncbi:MAG TPA: segregation/condensation protein A [Candidatus Kapabacteria bacterium]|nr:segregation/condensation protein A [Candidatus Kapabacteria bacterium]
MFTQQYQIKLRNFEGPFDLLLFLIKRDEINIYDIPIAQLAQEFLEYVHLIQLLDLELAGEFIVTAATLMQIKVRMLLPKTETETEEEDPRAELVRRLLEYKKYKEMAETFSTYENEQRDIYYRQLFKADEKIAEEEDLGETLLRNVSLFDLLTAFKRALDKAPRKPTIHTVVKIPVTVEEQCEYILGELSSRPQFSFIEFVGQMDKIRIVVTFLSLLELIRTKMIAIKQAELFDDILIYKQ